MDIRGYLPQVEIGIIRGLEWVKVCRLAVVFEDGAVSAVVYLSSLGAQTPLAIFPSNDGAAAAGNPAAFSRVLIESFTPGVMDAKGLGAAALRITVLGDPRAGAPSARAAPNCARKSAISELA